VSMPHEYAEYEQPQQEEELVIAPAPVVVPQQWSWNTDKLLWAAGAALALGFGVWFLMAFTGAKARAIAEAVTGNDGD